MKGCEGEGRDGEGEGRSGRGRADRERGRKDSTRICQGAVEFLVTPLPGGGVGDALTRKLTSCAPPAAPCWPYRRGGSGESRRLTAARSSGENSTSGATVLSTNLLRPRRQRPLGSFAVNASVVKATHV